MHLTTRLLLLCALAGAVAAPAPGQSPPAEITSLVIEGNEILTTRELESLLTTRETPGFVSRFLHTTISEALGRKDEFLDPVLLGNDLARMRGHLQDRGFFAASVDSVLVFSDSGRAVGITIRVTEGPRSIIDSLVVDGLVAVPAFVDEDLAAGRRIAAGDPYDQRALKSEVDNVLRVLRNAGYPNIRYLPDSSRARRRLSTGAMDVRLAFDIGRRFLFGPITIRDERNEDGARIADHVILDALDYRPGEYYYHDAVVESERSLNRLGLFDRARIQVSVPANADTGITVPSHVLVRPSDRHELAPEVLLSDENGNLNVGAGLGYRMRNFMGGGRTFSTRLRFRTQTVGELPSFFELQSDAVSNLDLTFELLQPYIFSNRIKGTWSFSLIVDKQRPYRQFIIRNKFSVTDRFAEFTNGYFDWALERVDIRRRQDIQPDAADAVVLASASSQFNSIFTFTIQRDKTNDIFSPSRGFIHTASIDEAGLLPLLLRRAQPDIPFTQFYRFTLSGRWYTDVSDARFSVLAAKLKAGIQGKYGESRADAGRLIPQTHRYYAGGGGSVRGWASRRLIASGDPALELGGDLLLEASVELRVNVLQSLRDGFFDKLWTTFFLDAGNTWERAGDLRLSGVGLAAGAGIRYDTFFGPFRIDFGVRVYDPLPSTTGARWIHQRAFFTEVVPEGVLHFGIGHAF